MSTRLYNWATKSTKTNDYGHLFNFKTGKEYTAMRYHFFSLGEGAELELTLFAPVLYANHWWLYVLDVENRKFYTLDSLNPKSSGGDRNKLGRFASNVLNQMRVRAGATTLFPNMTKNVGLHSFLAKYILVPRQPNAHDCGIYVLKYMDIVNPSLLGKRNFTVPVWTEFREQYVECILYHDDTYFRHKAIKASNLVTRHPRRSTALQSPYTQLNTADLESGKSDA
ncbi:hypothetical protein PIB30_006834 [Stylosanthes scabra]|uniref:Ubiquitin-like protease family profile domain-containing protein n=1 Tax=Stylosanthes scabra TaxID=79078 RepID=A0ABU6V674_9FABA|nr:hypothetical protein [Stylosanthes scabra]